MRGTGYDRGHSSGDTHMRARTGLISLCLAVLMTALPGCGSVAGQTRGNELDAQQYAYSAAIRWGDFAGARGLIDPKVLALDPVTDLELERYAQVQVSSYREGPVSRDLVAGTASREIQIGVINRHTQAERTMRYRETWRCDEASKSWLLTSGLPDFWQGQ